MKREVRVALERLFATGEVFDQVVGTLAANRTAALPILVELLRHPDPGWRRVAATALGRMRDVPSGALPDLLRLLRTKDVSSQVAAIAAIEWLPSKVRTRAVPAVIRVLKSRPPHGPRFTVTRANVTRGVAAHFLGAHGGARGVAALQEASQQRRDPVNHHIRAALRESLRRSSLTSKWSRRA